MRIILAEHYGLCFGVRDALRQAETLVADGPLTVLGELVQNPLALERLRAQADTHNEGAGQFCLQMTTALRPIVGCGDTFLPTKKLFFLSHWSKNLSGEAE